MDVRRGFDVWGFLLFSHGWTWVWWSVPIVAGWHVFRFPGIVFLLVGGIGVMVGGVVMTWLVDGGVGLRDLWRRAVDVRRIPGRWYLVIGVLWLGLSLGGAGVARLAGEPGPLVSFESLVTTLDDPLGLLTTLSMIFLFGPLPEEIGWRGYWLDHLQARWSALSASLLLGIAWAAWHAPLFLMVGYFSSWDFSPRPSWFAFNIVLGAVLYTWLYNNTNRSVLAAILFHFMGNATGQLLDLSPETRLYETLLTLLLVITVILWYGPGNLRRGAAQPPMPADATRS